MTPKESKELWRWAVYNRSFEMEQELDQMRSTFIALLNDGRFVHDKINLAERQMRVVELEIKTLKDLLGRIDYSPFGNVIPQDKEASDENIAVFMKYLLSQQPETSRVPFEKAWDEYMRCLSIYVSADTTKKFYLAAEATMR